MARWGRRSGKYDRIVAALKVKQPQTSVMLAEAMGDHNISMQCSILVMEGIVKQRKVSGSRWLAVDDKVFADIDNQEQEKTSWRNASATVSQIRKHLRRPSSRTPESQPEPTSPE